MNKEDIPFHLYLGGRAIFQHKLCHESQGKIVKVSALHPKVIEVQPPFGNILVAPVSYVKLIVRRLHSITLEEFKEWIVIAGREDKLADADQHYPRMIEIMKERGLNTFHIGNGEFELVPKLFLFLLSKGFWLFDESAFDEGLIIDAATLK